MNVCRREGTIVLRRDDVAALLNLDDCIAAVERAFVQEAAGGAVRAAILGMPAKDGGFHIKAATLDTGRAYFAAKVNANFPENPRRGRPAIQGVIVLADAETGAPLAVLDSIEITIQRTGAATALATRHFARRDARVATICGCGRQGRVQLQALTRARRIERVHAYDRDPTAAARFAEELGAALGLAITPAADLPAALRASDMVVTCTPSRRWFVAARDIAPGTFIAAVGADSEDKQELEPELLAQARVVVDALEQCAAIGELHHALDAGLVARADVYATLGQVLAGLRPGRERAEDIVIFDSTGTALQDVAAAAVVYEAACAAGRGAVVHFS